MSDLFSAEPTDPKGEQSSSGWLDKVVAEKGEQFRDPEQLAKSVFNANMHIKQLEEENRKYKESMVKEEYGKQLLDELRKQQPTSGEHSQLEQPITGGKAEATPQYGPEEIKKLVNEAVTLREHERTQAQNHEEVDRILRERYGDNAKAELTKRAAALNLDLAYLAEIGGKSPSALFAILGEKPVAQTNRAADSSVNSMSLNSSNSGKRDWRYYQSLRKENPKHYRTSQVQMQMEKDYAELGEKFWD